MNSLEPGSHMLAKKPETGNTDFFYFSSLINISLMNFGSILLLALSFVSSFVRSFVRSFVFQHLSYHLCFFSFGYNFLDLPWRSYKLTVVRASVRPCVCYQLFSRLAHWFLLIFGTKMQNGNPQNMTEPDFRKKFFQPKIPEICRKTRFFDIFSRFLHYFFQIFCTKMRISNAHNMAESDF